MHKRHLSYTVAQLQNISAETGLRAHLGYLSSEETEAQRRKVMVQDHLTADS